MLALSPTICDHGCAVEINDHEQETQSKPSWEEHSFAFVSYSTQGGFALEQTMKETWKGITGYEDKYEVSNLGRVRSLDRTYMHSGTTPRAITGRVLRLRPSCCGRYDAAVLCYNGVRVKVGVHRLVAKAFVPNPKGKPFVHHKDNNGKNNNASNLEWCTHGENMRWAFRDLKADGWVKVGTIKSGIENPTARPIAEIDASGSILKAWPSATAAAIEIGCHVGQPLRWAAGEYNSKEGRMFKFISKAEYKILAKEAI